MHRNAEKIGLERKRVKLLPDGQPNILDYSILNIIQELDMLIGIGIGHTVLQIYSFQDFFRYFGI